MKENVHGGTHALTGLIFALFCNDVFITER